MNFACADCGDVLPSEALSFVYTRPLCVRCAHHASERSKQDAEVWILEQLLLLAAFDPHVASTGTLTTRVPRSS